MAEVRFLTNKDKDAIDKEISTLKESIGDLKGSEATGISAELTGALRTYFTNIQTLLTQVAYTTQNHIGNTLIQNAQNVVSVLGGGEAEEPDEPVNPEVTLTSISATYTGGDVAVGTALTDLTGITVTATYSDESTSNVTGYSLSGTIAEGSNTITVTYSGLTTTFTVTGVAESVEPELTSILDLTTVTINATAGTYNSIANTEALSSTKLKIGTLANGKNAVASISNIPVEAGKTYTLVGRLIDSNNIKTPTNNTTGYVRLKNGTVTVTNVAPNVNGEYIFATLTPEVASLNMEIAFDMGCHIDSTSYVVYEILIVEGEVTSI